MSEPSHAELQQQVTDLLRMTGWAWLHVRRSIGRGAHWTTTTNVIGWPDLAPVWSPRQPGRHLAIELKVGRDKPSDEQVACLAALESAGFETMVIYPRDLEELAARLRHPGRHGP